MIDQIRKFGFLYNDTSDSDREFALAERYFQRYPNEIKISRKNRWNFFYLGGTIKHSYMKIGGKIVAIADGHSKVDEKVLGLVGEGGSARVKFARDKNGIVYVLKISKESFPDNETKILTDFGMMHGEKQSRNTISPKMNEDPKTKEYILMYYFGQDYSKYLATLINKNQDPIADGRITDARKIAWELYKLHKGEHLKEQQKIAHLDVKPQNIVRLDNGHIRLIDFGCSEEIVGEGWKNTSKKGTLAFQPAIYKQDKHDKNKYIPQDFVDKYFVADKMDIWGQVKCDIFALQRTIYHPVSIIDSEYRNFSLLNENEFLNLPTTLIKALDSGDDQSPNEPNVSTLDITYELIKHEMGIIEKSAYENNTSNQNKDDYTKYKRQVCKYFSLLDEVNEMLSDLSNNSSTRFKWVTYYQERIIATKDLNGLYALDLMNAVLSMKSAIKNLNEVKKYSSQDDKLLKESIDVILHKTPVDFNDVNKPIEEIKKKVNSPQVQAVKKEILRLRTKAKHWSTFDKKSILKKADNIENALKIVPIDQRDNLINNESQECLALRKALAFNRIQNTKYNELDVINTAKAASSFKNIYLDLFTEADGTSSTDGTQNKPPG